ncbi:hypothetical protein COT94_00115, partial [Candidatus Falkowbacteria bacterium CG10_big_fil_rev_8_21_14_0_10_37_14]
SKAVGDVPAGARKMEKGGQPRDLGPTNGLVGWWMLDGINGTDNLAGVSDNGSLNMGTSTAVTSTGRYGEANGAYSFNGVNTYVIVPESSLFDFGFNDFSISAWFLERNTTRAHILNFGAGSTNISFNTIGGYGIWIYWLGTGTPSVRINQLYNDSVWHQIVFRRSGDVFSVLMDDSPAIKATYPSQNMNTTGTLYIGAAATSYLSLFGSMADVRIYNRALSDSDVNRLYEATKP